MILGWGILKRRRVRLRFGLISTLKFMPFRRRCRRKFANIVMIVVIGKKPSRRRFASNMPVWMKTQPVRVPLIFMIGVMVVNSLRRLIILSLPWVRLILLTLLRWRGRRFKRFVGGPFFLCVIGRKPSNGRSVLILPVRWCGNRGRRTPVVTVIVLFPLTVLFLILTTFLIILISLLLNVTLVPRKR